MNPTNFTPVQFTSRSSTPHFGWRVPESTVEFDAGSIKALLLDSSNPCYLVSVNGQFGISQQAFTVAEFPDGISVEAYVPAIPVDQLGDAGFLHTHGTRYAFYAGAMANGIASAKMVIALGQHGFLGSFGAAGLVPATIEKAIHAIQTALPNGPYAFNLIHSPSEPALERGAVELYLKHGVHTVEASAFLDLTPSIVYYRVSGLAETQEGHIQVNNKVIAKISRGEVASKFMHPAPEKILSQLVQQGMISERQAQLAQYIPMADDITVEADSGGHTDNRPLVSLLPSILSLRDDLQAQLGYATPVRVGAGGGIGTPMAALGAFMMGAAYIVTGSVNQACVEAGASEHTRKLLAQADMADVTMAPAADMFEMGVKLQVLKRGTLFAMRAQKLYELYMAYNSIEEIPAAEREKIEKQIFRQSLDQVWQTTVSYFSERDPQQIERAKDNPKRKMALIFRWYLGLSSRWSNSGEPGREMDYQIWSGPAMGAFNAWTHNSYLADYTQRHVVDVNWHILSGSAYLYRIQQLQLQGATFSPELTRYIPYQ
ncbi:MAG: PfaD family polyunsaturated fatty acid/polyketide biosynthesis protein [SAR324 cluster bacterium]|nr:PfaD family polyunsaturated fatty acid/polyketide biosynthesis protein [SAR324 cluster bacterium]